MNSHNRIARLGRFSLLTALSGLSALTALAQTSDQERSALEEEERQRNIARTFAANARQVVGFDIDGTSRGRIGEPELYTFVKYSPDLSRVATVRFDLQEERSDVWILDVASGDATRLSNSQAREFVQTPVWSTDGGEIAYVALRGSRFGVYRQAANGEAEAELIYEHPGGPIQLGDWSLDGQRMAFSSSDLSGGRLYQLELDGDREPVLLVESEHSMNTPRYSPDGRYLSYFSDLSGRVEYYMIPAEQIDGEPQPVQVTTNGAFGIGQWDVDGSKYYYLGAERRVMAVNVDTSGDLALGAREHIYTVPDAIPAGGGGGLVTLSATGEELVMALPPVPDLLQIAVIDRAGNEVGRIGEPGLYFQPSFSPDGTRLVALRQDVDSGTQDVWVFDVATGAGTQVTSTVDLDEDSPIWLPDGEHVAYSYFDDDYSQIYRKRADGRGDEEFLFRFTPGAFMTLMDASDDGEYLAIESFGYVVTVPLSGDDPFTREGIDLLREEFEVSVPRFSPDGHFVAYTYNESGRDEVYITGFDSATGMAGAGERLQVSTGGTIGGISWRADGRELFYLQENLATEDELNDAVLMAVEVTMTPMLSAGTPRELFDLTLPTQGNQSQWQNADADGEQFLFALPAD